MRVAAHCHAGKQPPAGKQAAFSLFTGAPGRENRAYLF